MTSERIFDKYEVVRRLAFGGMGEVFLARQTGVAGFERLVILKSLLPHLAEDDFLVEEFLNEARLAATLNHPNIVSIFEVGKWRDVYFIAMEYIPGEDLGRLRRMAKERGVKIPLRVAARVVRDAALALHHAHSAVDLSGKPLCIVHRDVTPRNLMVRKDGVTKVVDFGIAKAADKASKTSTGAIKGTVAYMSPEQAHGFPVDGRSDQFALGVVLWELCTGRKLFTGQDPVHVLEAVRKMDIPAPSEIEGKVPKGIDHVVGRMLQRDPDRRFASCEEVAEVLGRLLGDHSGPKGQERVARFVLDVAGAEIEERARDLTPRSTSLGSGVQLFAPAMSEPGAASPPASDPVSQPSHTTLKTATSIGAPPHRERAVLRGVLAGVALGALVLAAAGGGFFFAVQRERPSESASVDAEPLPPVRFDPRGTPSPRTDDGRAEDAPVAADARAVDAARGGAKGASTSQGAASADRVEPTPPRERRAPEPRPRPAPRRPSSTERTAKPAGDPEPAPPAEAERSEAKGALLTLRTRPWTRVVIDGEDRGVTPLFRVKLSPGTHLVHLVNEEAGIDEWREIRAVAGRDMRFDWELGGEK